MGVRKALMAPFWWLMSFPTVPLLIFIQGVSALLWWIAGSYFGMDTYSSRSLSGNDGWCDPSIQGLGVHCWGDYYYPIFLLSIANPFSGEFVNPYPAAGLLPFLLFRSLGDFAALPALGLGLYLSLMVGTIAWSVWKATVGTQFNARVGLFSALTLFSPPVVMALDRGNSVGFLIPLLIWFFASLRKDHPAHLIASLVLMSMIKPHFVLLALALMFSGRIRVGVQSALLSLVANTVSFTIFWWNQFPENLIQWAFGVISYQDYATVAKPYLPNISFSQSIYAWFYGLDQVGVAGLAPVLDGIESHQGMWGIGIFALVLLMILLFRDTLSRAHIAVLMLSVISMLSATTYFYYALFAVPTLLALMREREDSSEQFMAVTQRGITGVGQQIAFVMWLASICTLVQLPIFGVSLDTQILTTGTLVGGVWIFSYTAIAIILIRNQRANANMRRALQ